MSDPSPKPSQPTNWAKSIVALVIYTIKAVLWLMLALLLIELGLRLFVESPPFQYGYHEDWGYYPAKGTFIIWGSEGYGINYFDDFGEQITPSDVGPNIVVLGDSHTESHQVGYDQNFVSIAESALVQKGINYNLRNLGKAYSSLADYIYLAPAVKQIYKSELVVIQISVQDFFTHEVYNKGKVNHFVKQDDGLKIVHNPPPFNDHWLGKTMQNIVLLVQGTKRKRLLFDGAEPAQAAADPANQSASAPIAFDVITPQIDMLKAAYGDTPVIIIMLPYTPTIQNKELVFEEEEYLQLLEQIQQIDGWHVIDPAAEFTELAQNEGQLPRGFSNSLPGTGHLNVHGHNIVGSLLTDQIEQMVQPAE